MPEHEPPRCRALDPGYGNKKKSMKQEKRLARRYKGRVVAGSGAFGSVQIRDGQVTVKDGLVGGKVGLSADVSCKKLLIEAKRTDKKSISIKGDWLLKLEAEADLAGRVPCLCVEIGGMKKLGTKEWAMVPMEYLAKVAASE